MPERTDAAWAATHAAQGASGLSAELAEVAGTEVGQLVMFPITPDVLHRIELGRVGRQALGYQPAALRGDKLLDQPRPMSGQSVPHHQQLARQVAQQMAEEVGHLGGPDSAWVAPEVKVPPGNAGGSRERFPIEVILQHRSLSAWRPSPHSMRALAQSALVDEDDSAPLRAGFFLIRGHSTFFQRAIACSSRSTARPVGRWQLQLSLRKMRQTWSAW